MVKQGMGTGTAMGPTRCLVEVGSGSLEGHTGRYEKRLSDLAGIYAEDGTLHARLQEADPIVYAVEELRPSGDAGDMVFGVTRMVPGRVGAEYFVTRGHIHATANRPEIYYGESGSGLMLLESLAGECRVIEIGPRVVCYVPPFWIHRLVNVGSDDLVTSFAYPADAGQNYEIITRSHGMSRRVVDDGDGGWKTVDNPHYRPRTRAEIERVIATAA